MIRLLLAIGMLATFLCPAMAQSTFPSVVIPVTITTGSTFQNVPGLVAGQTVRRSLTIQNNNTNTDNCWVFLGLATNATKGTAILLAPGQAYTRFGPVVPSDNIAVTCATAADTMYVDTQ